MISLVPSESWGGFKWVRASARNLGAGLCPAQSVWQGSGFAADQTNAMLAVVRADDESLVPPQAAGLALSVARPLPTETASLGFGGSPVGGGDKTPVLHFFGVPACGWYHYPPAAVAVSEQPRAGFISAEKTAFSEWVLCADERAVPSCTQCFFGVPAWGRYHYPRCALHAVETLDARGSRRRIYRFYAAPEFALCGLNLPSSGTHATPAPNRAHSGSHAETRRVIRVDGDDVLGSEIIDTIGPFQADQTVAVALAEGHRNAVSP